MLPLQVSKACAWRLSGQVAAALSWQQVRPHPSPFCISSCDKASPVQSRWLHELMTETPLQQPFYQEGNMQAHAAELTG